MLKVWILLRYPEMAGMWDFVLGAQWSRGGKSFICLSSTFTDSEGNIEIRILPTFSQPV